MAYKFSKGDRGLGDIKFEDDADTGLDFDQDRIDLQTNGQTRLKIDNSGVTIQNGNIYDRNNKSVIKHIDHGAFTNDDANNNEAFVPDDYVHDYGGSNYIVTFVPPFSGSIDKLVVRGVNNTNLSDLGNLTATVKIGNQGTNSYTIDTHPDTFESTTVVSSNLGAETNATFNFTASNFTPHDVYCVSLQPTNNWNNGGTKYINFTIVTSYLID